MFDRATATARSALYQKIREFFRERKVIEVEVPLLGCGAAIDPQMQSMHVDQGDKPRYLQTSPEYFLKRLLCEGSGDVYSICKAFRAGEVGRLHNPEFSLLEWYRVGFTLSELIQEVLDLLTIVGASEPVQEFTYAERFQSSTGLNPHTAEYSKLQSLASESGLVGELDHKGLQQFLMAKMVEPKFPSGLVILTDFPASQAELANIENDENGCRIAKRFEVYWNRVELANGYDELVDAKEQHRRFEASRAERKALAMSETEFDIAFQKAVERGMPECSGVALGLDRLLMLLLEKENLAETLSFPWKEI